jgi:amidase
MDTRHTRLIGGITRRGLLKLGAAGGVALLLGGRSSLLAAQIGDESAPWFEATIPDLQALMASGQLTSRALTLAYLHRIHRLKPLLGAVIETNPNAVSIAAQLDNERRKGRVRGPLHGIPVLAKDNIATDDNMETTAGSLALVGSRVPADATIVARLRAAGAVILGKTNLSEWANVRGFAAINGWSARGGFTRNPYVLDYDPCGSSSGSAVAPAANLCAVAVGTETDGSIVCPAGNNLVVGLKPTVGLVSQDGIIPIAHSQDTAGPMGRTVTDVAIFLGALQSPFGEVAAHSPAPPNDYTSFLHRGALHGARIGVDVRYFTPDGGGEADIVGVVNSALDVMSDLGATIVETDTGDAGAYFFAEGTVLISEFKVQIAEYLGKLRHTSIRTLADLIAFNITHCPQEMKYFGQEVFELSESTSGDITDPAYLAARELCLLLARGGIDTALQNQDLDAIVAPSYSFASSPAAVAGYPNISVPVGLRADGKPAGIWMYGGFLQESKLLALAYDIEQAIQPRSVPQFLGSLPPEPPDAGICGLAAAVRSHVPADGLKLWRHLGTGKRLFRAS